MFAINFNGKGLIHIPHFKMSKFLGILAFIFLGFLNGNANENVADYLMYQNWYNYTGKTGIFQFEKGYSVVGLWFYNHGFEYFEFRMFLSILTMVIMCVAISKFTDNILPIAILYFISTYFVDAIQIRSQLMLAIVMLGASFLKKVTKLNVMIYLGLVLLSTLIHSSGYFFFLIILLRLLPIEKLKRLAGYILYLEIPLIIIFSIFKKYISLFLAKIISTFSSRTSLTDKITTDYTSGSSKGELLAIVLLVMIVLILSRRMMEFTRINEDGYSESLILYSMSILSMMLLPFLIFSIDYSRLQRACFVLFIIQVGICLSKVRSMQMKFLIFIISVVVSVLAHIIFLRAYGSAAFDSIPLFFEARN